MRAVRCAHVHSGEFLATIGAVERRGTIPRTAEC
jgi:hypothetical protein